MRMYLKILAIVAGLSFIAGYASAELPTGMEAYERGLQYDQERRAVTNTLQRRMNQQYYNEILQGEIQQQQDEIHYQQRQEHMRNQGWGRPGLDGGVR